MAWGKDGVEDTRLATPHGVKEGKEYGKGRNSSKHC